MIPFITRKSELLAIEGHYDDIILSCRHKDILNCSKTKHFNSCFAKNRMNEFVPMMYCYNNRIAIMGKKDRSGQFIGRCFIRLEEYNFCDGRLILLASKIYGNGLDFNKISRSLHSVAVIRATEKDFYPWDLD
jgi:hypothetical protein